MVITSNSSNIVITGDFTVNEGQVVVVNAGVVASGAAVINGQVNFTACDSGTVQVVSAESLSLGPNAQFNPSCSCADAASEGITTSATSASVVVSVSNAQPGCGTDRSLSTGAIVGIAVGATIFGILLVVGLVLLTLFARGRRQQEAVAAAHSINMDHMAFKNLHDSNSGDL